MGLQEVIWRLILFLCSSFVASDTKVPLDIEAKVGGEACDVIVTAYHIRMQGDRSHKFKIFRLQFNTGLVPSRTAAIRFSL